MQKIKDVNKGDLLTFKASDGRYKVLLCTSTNRNSPQNYTFAALTYDNLDKPTIEKIYTCEFYGTGNRKSNYFKYSDNEIEKMWTICPEIKPYDLGSYGLIVWRKDFTKFSNNFSFIGNVAIIDHIDKNGNGSMNASNWDFLQDFFNEKYKTILPERRQKTYKLKAILRE